MEISNSTRNATYKRKFGITLEQYDKLWDKQKGVCAICGGVNKTGKRLAVDHNHETKEVRGLLCCDCNIKLGFIERYKGICKIALEYLNKGKQ